jgi:protein arginine N-methyltransferase 1
VLDEHLGYASDHVRNERMRAGIARIINAGDRVADLGCGSGILGMFCLQAGAGFVEAIDETPILEAARGSFERAGFGDRVRLHRSNSYRTTLAEPVDLVVCDHVGYFGFDYGIVGMLADARRRLLAPGGRILPRRIDLFLGLVRDEATVGKRDGWQAAKVPAEFHWLRGLDANRKHAVRLGAEDLLAEPAALGSLTLGEPAEPFLSWTTSVIAGFDGVVGGLAGWFRAELADDVWMTNAPGDPAAIDRPQALLPLESPLPVRAGDRVEVTVMARPADHVISWRVRHPASGRRYSQSTLRGELISAVEMRRRGPDWRPALNEQGRARRIVLDYCNGHRSAAEIEALVRRDHPGLMPSPEEISRFVTRVLAWDAE